MIPMPLLVMILVGAVAIWWSTARAAAERAEIVGRNACHAAGVQWLDQTVHATSIRLRRNKNGWLGLERSFRFEYSHDGIDRHIGHLAILGKELVDFSGPLQATNVVEFR